VLIVVLVVVVVVVVLAAFALWAVTMIASPVSTFTRVTVTAASWSIIGDSTDFASSSLTCGSQCPITVFTGSSFSYTLALVNSDSSSAHNVTSIDVNYPFTMSSLDISPALPYTVAAGGHVSFVLTITASTIGGSYTLTGSVTTS
jgi:hypothetical protein